MRVQNNGITNGSLQADSAISLSVPNVTAAQEITVDTGAASAETSTGGVRVNLIPRDGGNQLSGLVFVSIATDALQGSNFTDRLKAAGLRFASAASTDRRRRSWPAIPSVMAPRSPSSSLALARVARRSWCPACAQMCMRPTERSRCPSSRASPPSFA